MHDHAKPFFSLIFHLCASVLIRLENKTKIFMHVLACVISKLHIFDQVSGSRVTNALFTRGFPLDKIIKMTSMLPYIKLLFRIVCNIDFPHLSITLDHILLANSGAVCAQVVYEPVWKVMETRATG